MPAKEGTVEAWGRSEDNPVGGWYGLRKSYRGRFGMYVPPLFEALGKAELTHEPHNNKARCLLSDLRSRAPSSGPLAARAAFVAHCEEMQRQPITRPHSWPCAQKRTGV